VPSSFDLVHLINSYRQRQGLHPVPVSPALMSVAQAHVMDLMTHHPEESCGNLHSWSRNGPWEGGCYAQGDAATHRFMWDKPQEIAKYSARGFEIACKGAEQAEEALMAWQSSPPHHDVILNRGPWASLRWEAIGAALGGGYACAWFA
jgi:hypothetical protein